VYSSQGSERFTDFGSRPARRTFGGFIRRVSGGLFSVKVAAVKRKANQSLSITPMEPDIPTVIPTTIPTTKSRDGTKAVAFCGQGKVLHLLSQGMVRHLCIRVTLHKSFWNQCFSLSKKVIPLELNSFSNNFTN